MNFSCTVWQAFVNDHASLILSEEERMGMADPESDGSKRDELWSWKFFIKKKKLWLMPLLGGTFTSPPSSTSVTFFEKINFLMKTNCWRFWYMWDNVRVIKMKWICWNLKKFQEFVASLNGNFNIFPLKLFKFGAKYFFKNYFLLIKILLGGGGIEGNHKSMSEDSFSSFWVVTGVDRGVKSSCSAGPEESITGDWLPDKIVGPRPPVVNESRSKTTSGSAH